ncbi:fused MFS/spermidine synthase [Candidatus Woesearchaeota archaeon]|nr:fused MFS/spermidine synthase [Candidatus Woesearchaeota archaeon]
MFFKNIPKREKLLFFAITALGISAMITQLTIMREFLTVFYGNELVFGIILGNWLLLTGIGSYLGKYIEKVKDKFRLLIISEIIIAVLPFFHIFIIRNLRNLIFLPGELIGAIRIFLSSFVILLPYCIISGSLLILACCVFTTKKDSASIGKVYFIDAIGDILGGFLFSFILIYFLNHFQMALFIMILNLLAALLLSIFIKNNILKYSVVVLFLLLVIGFFSVDLEKLSIQQQYKGQELLFHKNSRYGSLVVTKTADQLNFFENGIALFATENTIANEETVHYAMVQHEAPKNILLISGGVSGTVNEILKYNPDNIDYIELDPLIIDVGKRFTTNLENEKIKIHNIDARLFVKQTNNKYDIVIIDLPDPSTAQINRFYTIEFFKELKQILNDDAVISLSLSSAENYMSKEVRQSNSALYKTLSQVFSNIIIIPDAENFFIASDKELTYDIAEKIEEKAIQTDYVNKYYLIGKLTEDRINLVLNSINEDVPLNKDLNPITYFYHLLYWISYFKVNYSIFFIIFAILVILYLLKTKPIPFAIFTTGFAASSLEVIILIGFQILYGYVYHKIGVIVTMFMLGLALGSHYMNRTLKKKSIKDLVKIEFSILLYSILLPVIFILLKNIKNENLILLSAQFAFPILTLILAILVGMEFPLAAKLHFKKVAHTAGILYASDFIGACIGAILVSTLLIPLLGIVKVCILIGALNLISGTIMYLNKK